METLFNFLVEAGKGLLVTLLFLIIFYVIVTGRADKE